MVDFGAWTAATIYKVERWNSIDYERESIESILLQATIWRARDVRIFSEIIKGSGMAFHNLHFSNSLHLA